MKRLILACLLLALAVSAYAQGWEQIPPQTTRTYYGCWFNPESPDHGAATRWYYLAYDQVPFVYTTVNGGHPLVDHNIYAQSGYMLRTARTVFFVRRQVIGTLLGSRVRDTSPNPAGRMISSSFSGRARL